MELGAERKPSSEALGWRVSLPIRLFFSVEETSSGGTEPNSQKEGSRTEPQKGGGEVKTFKVGMVAVAILLVVPGIGFGIAQAGSTDWTVEELEAYIGYLQEDRPVLSFEDQEPTQVAKSPTEDMQLENPIETGSLHAESIADFDPFSRGGP